MGVIMNRTMQDLAQCEISAIWIDFKNGASYKKLAKKYDVKMFTVREIVNKHFDITSLGGKTWRRVK